MSLEPDSDDRSATTIIVSELLRTPAFKELLKARLQAATEGDARALAHSLLWEDVDVSMGAASRLPLLINSLVQAVGELNALVEQTSPLLRRAYFARLGEQVDGEALMQQSVRALENLHVLLWEDPRIRAGVGRWLAGLTNHGLRQLTQMHRKDPSRLAEPARALLGEVLPHLDFGLLRAALTAMADSAATTLPDTLARVAGDPVAMANLLESLPPLLNSLISLSARALSSADLPPEVLASALFNLVQKVEASQLGALCDELGAKLLTLHEGSLVLGRHQPRLQAVLARAARDLLASLDRQQLARVLVALGEDAGTLARVLGQLLLRDPELLSTLATAGAGAAGATLQGLADAVGDLSRLPEEQLAELFEGLHREAPTNQAVRLINGAAALTWRLLQRQPEPSDSRPLQRSRETLDRRTLGRVAWRLLGPLVRRQLQQLTPERAGQLLGDGLISAAEALERNPTLVRETVEQALLQADAERTRRLVDSTVAQLREALAQRPELVRALAQPLVATMGSLVWEYLRNIGQERKEQQRSQEQGETGGLRQRLWRRLKRDQSQ